MKIVADTNVLLRAFVNDDPAQSESAQTELAKAETIAVATPALCELVWVLARSYKVSATEISHILRSLLNMSNVALNRSAVEAGLEMLEAGGDFADGVIAYEGRWLGADTFVSFDKTAVELLQKQGKQARLLV
ncbi:type II toxin-antitoxin system VapC family toxin [Methylovirgula sp. 4M-Z18]|uniref:type II toxin-antitoxin system VapC family toxin n=1 Tax=Methylovirgula sp. 4M-Z18 TaxID=2293567 RepID=UPI000E2F5939|nr:type II toxin-antitoxin system VapC family toxin [Methylovirgula sp. 4M-Z18]RFB79180.1 PIN domain-containing protein [Methylovirgula sp. 4M-Z18]